MPQTLSTAFTESRVYVDLQNTYHDGARHIGLLAQTSRHTFKLSKRLTAAQLSTLKTFWDSVNGGLTPFYFYNPFAGVPPGSNYDATGVTTTGRYTVVFKGSWSQQTDLSRSTIGNLELVEVQ